MSEKLRLGVVIASVRPTRVGDKVGHWVAEQARTQGGFDVDLIDLADLAPFPDEPHHPRTGDYVHEHTRSWSRRVAACQAFVLVTPEYNHGYPAPLKSALDAVLNEWASKPVGFASYGGVSGGLRAVQQLKQVVLALRMIPVHDGLVAPVVGRQVVDGVFVPSDVQVVGAQRMLDELETVGQRLLPLQ
ncbi:MAG TPA: NAD(P)H-dependent oxidoreductase [Nocardioides sp.]|uniref:NADPH-dependent FMN reductase n=1 Tax=Nocardioides sp. TaxID=35761 RepID=UPI002C7777BD|nr:NAD(P)H-dependent oxidoreductase [Nocardioides sp.]HTW15606.1 NAD(P)H-dependent oxidoreductase [Nocardioides sp.]